MKIGPRLPRRFFDRPSVEVARELVGVTLVRRQRDGERLVGRLVEVEAYLGDGSDPASHAHRGPTPRNRSMFGPPGRLYAYRSYGIHTCINVVCQPAGTASAVLLRALEPLSGIDTMCANRGFVRGERPDREIARGPGRLAQALGLGLDCDGGSALGGVLSLHAAIGDEPVAAGPRVGITKAAELPYRFFVEGSAWVSASRAGGRRKKQR